MDKSVRAGQDLRRVRHLPPLVLALLISTSTAWAGPPELDAGVRAAKFSGPEIAARPTYPHRSVRRAEFGVGALSYWLYEPAEPVPGHAPVVVLNHGWLAVNPGVYGAWIDHLVRSGHVVVFPRYQADALTPPPDFLTNAVAAVLDALDVLEAAPGHVRPDRDRFALIGHSAGGNLAAQMAAVASARRLPVPRAVIALMPGEVRASREPALSEIPAETLLVVTAAEDDRIVGDARARQIFTQASAVPLNRKKFVLYRTDLHGSPKLVAHHFAPTSIDASFDSGDGLLRGVQVSLAELNVLDRSGFWRLADATLKAAFSGRTLDEATDRGEVFRHLGYWSDGRLVERPLVGDDLAAFPRVIPTNGVRLIQWLPDRFQPAVMKATTSPPSAVPLERIAVGNLPIRRE